MLQTGNSTIKLESRIINTILEKAIKDKECQTLLILNLSLLAVIVTSTFLEFTVPEPQQHHGQVEDSLAKQVLEENTSQPGTPRIARTEQN